MREDLATLIIVFGVLVGWMIGSVLGVVAVDASYVYHAPKPPTLAQIHAQEREDERMWRSFEVAEYRLLVQLERLSKPKVITS